MDIKFNTEQMMNTAVAIEDDASNYQRIYEQLINAASTMGPRLTPGKQGLCRPD